LGCNGSGRRIACRTGWVKEVSRSKVGTQIAWRAANLRGKWSELRLDRTIDSSSAGELENSHGRATKMSRRAVWRIGFDGFEGCCCCWGRRLARRIGLNTVDHSSGNRLLLFYTHIEPVSIFVVCGFFCSCNGYRHTEWL
jgi:hypothetical protein